MTKDYEERILGALWGAVVGDALGVPVEFMTREDLRADPVTGMRNNGVHRQPAGTWSDDTSLMLCTVESFLGGFDVFRMARLFSEWLHNGYWTPWGKAFGVGRTTRASIGRMATGAMPEQAGGADEDDNGNGSLMRILPVGLYFSRSSPGEIIESAHRASSLTHRHPRSQIGCAFQCVMVSSLLKGVSAEEAYREAIRVMMGYYDDQQPYVDEFQYYARLLSGWIANADEGTIRSEGYVVDTLEAALWCLLTTGSLTEAVLKAVNLGGDADTTGTVTGGLAGILYGARAIPEGWINGLARKRDLQDLFGQFQGVLRSRWAD